MTKACLITGAAGGIGRALCEGYAAAGWRVIATDRVAADDVECAAFLRADVAELSASVPTMEGFVADVESRLDGVPLACLVNNAALQVLGSVDDLSVEDFRRSFEANTIAPFALVKAFGGHLAAAGGTVVNIGSVHARATKRGFAAYSTSKAALHGLTRALALDLGPDVRVNALAPAATATPMLLAGFEGEPEAFAALADAHPLRRIAEPDEIAKGALFLSGPESSFLTGATLYADGGVLSRLHDPL